MLAIRSISLAQRFLLPVLIVHLYVACVHLKPHILFYCIDSFSVLRVRINRCTTNPCVPKSRQCVRAHFLNYMVIHGAIE